MLLCSRIVLNVRIIRGTSVTDAARALLSFAELFLQVVDVESIAVVVQRVGFLREPDADGIKVVDSALVGLVEHKLVLEAVESVEVFADEVVAEADLRLERLFLPVCFVNCDKDKSEGCRGREGQETRES